ncbi:MAG: hypothetical protein JKY56_16130, partial [Kofleriaceae bacterium]|nr:hypothetical protein [Kofleriaceae bacterium]
MKLSTLLLTAILSAFVATGSACTGTITDGGLGGGGGGGGDDTPLTPEEEAENVALCIGDGEAGGICEVSADCNSPQVCHSSGVCVGPRDASYTCDSIEGILCGDPTESCIDGFCVLAPGACETLDDCPNGFDCTNGMCTTVRDGSTCSDPGPGPALAGTYKTKSILHLRDGLPGALDTLLDVADDARKLINGEVDLGLPSLVELVIGGIVSSYIRQYVPPYAIDLVNGLATMGDIFDDMGVEGTLKLDGQACDGNYQGSHSWDMVTINFNGREVRQNPNDIPGVDEVVPENFGARYHCGDLLLDKHRIQNSLTGLFRFLIDAAIQISTPFNTIEEAMTSLVDCNAVANSLANACDLPFGACGAVYGVVRSGCEGLVQVGVAKVTQAIDEAALKLTLIKLRAIIPVNSDGTFEDGVWYGSLIGGDFLGEIDVRE